MRDLFVITFLAALVLTSGHTHASPSIYISAEDLQTLQTKAAQGNANAQYSLGLKYGSGLGVPQDYTKARQWLEQAAAQGLAEAQYLLGLLYVEGKKGVPQDYAKARQFFEQAAAQGDADAQNELGVMYSSGEGMPKDYVRSYMWRSLSVARSTGDRQKSRAKNRDTVTNLMTPAQIAEGLLLAQQCQARQFKGC
jgi:TPR repeat protein